MFQRRALQDKVRQIISVTKITSLPSSASDIFIGTHSGKFHCDEVLACVMLRLLFPDLPIVRTRDRSVFEKAKMLVDVGDVYDPETNRFDHHQGSFSSVFPGKNTKLSSAGLVYLHFGRDIIRLISAQSENPEVLDSSELEIVFNHLYDRFFEPIDANDNGIAAYDGIARYHPMPCFSSQVNRLNPGWSDGDDAELANIAFREAMLLAGSELVWAAQVILENWRPARKIVASSMAKAQNNVLLLDESCPWQSHLFKLEAEQGCRGRFLYCVFGSGGQYRIQAVSVAEGSFESRKPLPEAWRSLRDETLDGVTGVPGGVFVHNSGFIGGHTTLDGALKMAEIATNL